MDTAAPDRFRPLIALAAWLIALSMLVPACAWAQGGGKAMREVLGPGDTVRITVFRHPDLTTETRITEDGRLNVPLVGPVPMMGKTPDEAAVQIASLLKKNNYLVNPQVDVSVLEARSRQVSVLGFVTRPGRYMLEGSSAKVTDVLAMAGGLVPAAADNVIVTRARDGKSESLKVDLAAIIQRGETTKDIEVGSGDSVFVPKAPVVYVYGEVLRGGSYRLEADMTVMQAISLAGGISPRGSENRIKLRRKGADGKWTEVSADARDQVGPDDVVYVREGLF